MSKRAKKNRTYIENLVISQKVDEYIREGYPLEQAQAISFRQYRDGELKIPKLNRQQSRAIKQQRERQIQGLMLLYNLGKMAYNSFKKKE